MRDVALEVPLSLLAFSRRAERNDRRAARVEGLNDPLDRSALAGGVASLEQRDDLQALVLDPVLQLDQLELQPGELGLINPFLQLLGLGVAIGHCDSSNARRVSRCRARTSACCQLSRRRIAVPATGHHSCDSRISPQTRARHRGSAPARESTSRTSTTTAAIRAAQPARRARAPATDHHKCRRHCCIGGSPRAGRLG